MTAHYQFIFNLVSTITPSPFEQRWHLHISSQPALIHGIVMPQVHNFAFCVQLYKASDGPVLKSLKISLDLCFAIHVSHSH